MRFTGIVFAAIFIVFSASSFAQPASEKVHLDKDLTYVGFEVSYFLLLRVAGQFRDFEGSFVIDRENSENSKADIIIKTASVDTGSLSRDKDIRGPTLFNADVYPEMIFHSSKISHYENNTGVITGDLTLRGITKPVTLDIVRIPGPDSQEAADSKSFADGFFLTGNIKRSDFGMNDFIIPIGDVVTLFVCYKLEKCDGSMALGKKISPRYNQ